MNYILPLVLAAMILTACASPQARRPDPTPSATPPAPTRTRTVVRPTVTAAPNRAAKPSVRPTPTSPQKCAGLASGLYVIGVEPLSELVWDAQRRSFKVELCNANSGATASGGELSLFIYVAGAKQPIGQTGPWWGAISPGYQERIVGDWKPGLENHKTICVQKPVVELEVVFRQDRKEGWYQTIRFPDGRSRTPYPIRCAGDYA